MVQILKMMSKWRREVLGSDERAVSDYADVAEALILSGRENKELVANTETEKVLSGVQARRNRELTGVILCICQAWDRYHTCTTSAQDALQALDREIEAAAATIGHKKHTYHG